MFRATRRLVLAVRGRQRGQVIGQLWKFHVRRAVGGQLQLIGHVVVVVGVQRFEQEKRCDLISESLRVTLGVGTAQRMADDHVGRRHLQNPQQGAELVGDRIEGAWQHRVRAPTGAGAVVDNRRGELSDSFVGQQVVQPDCASASQKHDRGAAIARAIDP